jgi:hypothetical protein
MSVSQEGIEVTNRSFTRKYGLNRWNVNTVKWNPEKKAP